ncbi:MAG: hypothetical protein C0618_02840 [Desulfuromonas sp.]|nr:MAG: hypothetical protein C0618_02840 [Desulfuromonas sp.]
MGYGLQNIYILSRFVLMAISRVVQLVLFALTLLVMCALPSFAESDSAGRESVRIGVLAKRGEQKTHARWDSLAEYLSLKLPAYQFYIVPLSFDEIHFVIDEKQVEFVLANSAIYVDLEVNYGVSRLATLKNLRGEEGLTVFAGTIFSRAERNDIRVLEDLQGKSFMAVDERSFGGFHMAWRELMAQGIDPYRDFSRLEMGGTHDAVVYGVASGRVDSGTVRSDTLERMAEEGKIDLNDFRVLNPKKNPMFPFLHSTRLYPEWPFAKVAGVSNHLAQQVAIALLQMPEEGDAARIAESRGWSIPHEYQPVHDCLKSLQIAPYQDFGKVTIWVAIQRLWVWFLLGTVLMIAAYLTVIHTLRMNRKLSESREALAAAHSGLEEKVASRTRELKQTNQKLQKEIREHTLSEEALSEERTRLDNIVKSLTNGLVVTDTTGKIVLINPVAQKIFNVTYEQSVGSDIRDLFLRYDVEEMPFEVQQDGQNLLIPWEFELPSQSGKGKNIYQALTSEMRNEDAVVAGKVTIIQNVTKERELSRLKDCFISTAAHELHTPLTSIIGYSDLLLQMEESGLATVENRKDFLQEISDKGHGLSRIVDELLDVSRIESGQPLPLQLQPTDVHALIERVVNQYRQFSSNHDFSVSINVGADTLLMVDQEKLVQVFENLLSNAVKYSPEGGQVEVALDPVDGAFRVAVRDAGVGMSEGQVDRIFDKFYRADNADPAIRGLGLGMSIVKQIVEDHGGKIWVESCVGEGTRVYFTLPDKTG